MLRRARVGPESRVASGRPARGTWRRVGRKRSYKTLWLYNRKVIYGRWRSQAGADAVANESARESIGYTASHSPWAQVTTTRPPRERLRPPATTKRRVTSRRSKARRAASTGSWLRRARGSSND